MTHSSDSSQPGTAWTPCTQGGEGKRLAWIEPQHACHEYIDEWRSDDVHVKRTITFHGRSHAWFKDFWYFEDPVDFPGAVGKADLFTNAR